MDKDTDGKLDLARAEKRSWPSGHQWSLIVGALCLAIVTWRVLSTLSHVERMVDRTQVTTTIFDFSGGKATVSTDRLPGEPVGAWMDRHKEALEGLNR